MANESELDVDSQNNANDVDLDTIEDINVLKEQFQKVSETNKQLFARAKKAEGFELKDGKWLKPEAKPKAEAKSEVEPPKSKDPSQPNELDYGEKAYLRSALNIKGADEFQLAKEWKAKYGMTAEEMETDEVFLNRLNNLRQKRESDEAIPKGKGRSAQTASTEVDVAYAKFKESGAWPSDFETANKLSDKIIAEERGSASIYQKK